MHHGLENYFIWNAVDWIGSNACYRQRACKRLLSGKKHCSLFRMPQNNAAVMTYSDKRRHFLHVQCLIKLPAKWNRFSNGWRQGKIRHPSTWFWHTERHLRGQKPRASTSKSTCTRITNEVGLILKCVTKPPWTTANLVVSVWNRFLIFWYEASMCSVKRSTTVSNSWNRY
jgi:hypothetical protein